MFIYKEEYVGRRRVLVVFGMFDVISVYGNKVVFGLDFIVVWESFRERGSCWILFLWGKVLYFEF